MSTPDNFNSRGVPNRVQIDNQSLPIIITLLLLVFFFVGFLAVYICRCVMEYFTGVLLRRNNPSGNLIRQRGAATHGIDPSILSSFPTFEYSKVKNLKQDKGGLECAVCLTEFEDSDMVRLLNVCNHAFHPECIDLWLESHTTCPVCRRDLSDPLQESPEKTPEVIVTIPNAIQPTSDQGDESRHDDNSSTTTRRVSFKDDDILRMESNIIGSMSVQCSGADHVEERFSRSHSTGHSLMILSGDHERYTLRLTEDVMKRITRGHNVTGSCTTFEEFSGDITIEKNGLAEVSGISAGDNLTSVDSL